MFWGVSRVTSSKSGAAFRSFVSSVGAFVVAVDILIACFTDYLP
jgi:hypothetical protein